MATAPTFDPNQFGRSPAETRRNRAIADAYEPGSTFKIVTGALALEQTLVTLDETIDTGDGTIRVGDDDLRARRKPVRRADARRGLRALLERRDHPRRAAPRTAAAVRRARARSASAARPASTCRERTSASSAGPTLVGALERDDLDGAGGLGHAAPARAGRRRRSPTAAGSSAAPRAADRPPRTAASTSSFPRRPRGFSRKPRLRTVRDLLVGVVERGTGEKATIPGFRRRGKNRHGAEGRRRRLQARTATCRPSSASFRARTRRSWASS